MCAIRLASDLRKNSARSISFLSKRGLSTLTKKKQNNQKQNSPEEVHADLALVHNVHLLQQIFSNLLKNSNHHPRPMVNLKFGCKFLRSLFQEILTAPLASQLQEPEELVSSLENVQIQYLILDSISQADKIFCCIFACV